MNNNEWLDIDVLEDYLDGKLDAKTMHRVERISLEDPFVAEALAGLSASPKRVQSLSLLQKQLQDRIAQKPVQEKRWQITSQRLSIAAAAAVLFVTVSLLFWMRENSNREKIAANTPKKVEVAIAATKEPEKPIVKNKEEIEKVVAEANQPAYANNSKKSAPTKSAITPLTAAPSPSITNASEGVSLRSIEIETRKEVSSKQVPSALAGRVAGIRLNAIKGAVYAEDGLPIPGASVKFKGTSKGTITDAKGQFSLSLDSMLRNPTLNVASIGFMPKEINFKKDENLAIKLEQDNATLNEVVITGYGTQQKRTTMASSASIVASAAPVIGWDKFEEYVVNNNRLLVDKKLTGRFITVTFNVDKGGNPIKLKTPKRLEMVPSQTEAEEKEAIRLVKEGPKWAMPSNVSASTTHTVNIRF